MAIRFDHFQRDVSIGPAKLQRACVMREGRGELGECLREAREENRWMARRRGIRRREDGTNVLSLASQTVEKSPHPNFRTTTYRPRLKSSPMLTG